MVPTLDALRDRGAKLAVVTNKPEALARQLMEALQLADRFEAIVGADTTPEAKPSARPAIHTAEQLAVTPQQVLFVGDSVSDVGCARAWGCPVVVMSYGYSQGTAPSELGADAVIDSFAALL